MFGKLFGKKVLSEDEITQLNPSYKNFKEIQQDNQGRIDANSVLTKGGDADDMGLEAIMSQSFEFTDTDNNKKKEKLNKYRKVASFPEIADIIDEYINGMIVFDDQGNYANLKLKQELNSDPKGNKVSKLQEEFAYWLSLFRFETDSDEDFRNFIVDAELTYENIIDNENPGDGVVGIKKIPAETYDYIFDINNNIVGILLNAQRCSKDNSDVTMENVEEKFKEAENKADGIEDKPSMEMLKKDTFYQTIDEEEDIIPIPITQITHITSGITNSTGTVNYSIIERLKRPFNQLRLTEDAITIYRIIRAPLRYMFNIHTGSMPWHKARRVIERLKEKYGRKKYYDPASGSVSGNFDVQSITESFWFAKGADGKGSEVSTIGEGQNMWSDFPDLEYYLRKLYRVAKVPFIDLFDSGDGGQHIKGKEEVTYEDYRLAKLIMSFQKRIASGLYEGFKTHLQLKGLWKQYGLTDNHFYVQFVFPTLFELYHKQKIMNIKFENYDTLVKQDSISNEYAQREALDWNEPQIADNRRKLLKERLWQAQIEKAEDNVSDSGLGEPTDVKTDNDDDSGGRRF